MAGSLIVKAGLRCLALLMLARAAVSCKFIVSAPNVLRVPSETVIHVLVEGASNVNVRLSLRGLPAEVSSNLQDGQVKELTMQLSYDNTMDLSQRDNNATLVATFTGGCNEERETNVVVTFRSCIVAIQTDKPIYKTRDPQAHFRFYPITPLALPLDEDVRCYIRDNESIIIEDFRNPLTYTLNTALPRQEIRGMFLRRMNLKRIYPRPGTYQATCMCGKRFSTEYTTLFQIDEYVLPTFSAQIVKVQSCVNPEAETIPVTMRAEYTSGESLISGFGSIEIGVVNRENIPKVVSRGLRVEGGEGTTTFDVRLPKGNDDVHPVVGDVLYVKLFWHESGSDYRAEDIWTGTMYSEEAVVPKLENVPEYFQPGQPISYLVCSRTCTGEVATQKHMTVTETVDGQRDVTNSTTDEQNGGCFSKEVATLTGTREVRIEAKLTDGVSSVTKVLKAAAVCSVSASLRSTAAGFVFRASGLNGVATIVFQIISVGRTIHMEQKTQDLSAEVPFNYQVRGAVATSLTAVAYAYVANGGCAVASMQVPVDFSLSNKATVRVNQGGEIQYKNPILDFLFQGTAEPGSTVVFLAQDEALMVLKRNARLPDDFSLDRIRQYVDRFDPVCPGGGKNPTSLLQNSGVALLSNTDLPDSSRYHLSCNPVHAAARRRRREAEEEQGPRSRRRECWELPCQQLKDALVAEHCAKNEYQTADGECERKKRDSIPFKCSSRGCFRSDACNDTHCWCVNAIGETIEGTTEEGSRNCFDYYICRDTDTFTAPEGCELDCSGKGYQRSNNGCAICKCNSDAAELGRALALGCKSCEGIDRSLYTFRANYTSSVLRCSCYTAAQSGAILGRSYCCPFGARSGFDFQQVIANNVRDIENNQFSDPDVVEARKDFKSSWLLDDSMVIADSDGAVSLTPAGIPPSITKYHITMAAMHPEKGLGMAFSTLAVTTPLQVRTIVPYSVTVKEDFTVRCTVYHFGNDRLVVRLSLIVSSELCLNGKNQTATSGTFVFNGKGLWSQIYVVKAIEVTPVTPAHARCVAQTHINADDASQQDVHVEPEGERVHTSVNIPVDCDAKSVCPPGVCQNGGTPIEGLRCCYCQCPPLFTGQNCTENLQAVDVAGEAANFQATVVPRLLFLDVDKDILLTCTTSSLGLDMSSAVFSWRRLSKRPFPERVVFLGGILKLKDITREDQDDYICEVTFQGRTVSAVSKVIVGSRCLYDGVFSDNPCALRFFKPGNPVPTLVGFQRKPDIKQQIVTVDLSVNDAILTPNSMQCRVFVRGQRDLPLPAIELIEYDKLNSLIRLPRGCGEQTMMTLGPLVYAMNYLDDGNLFQGREQKRTEGGRNIHLGVQGEISHRNGKCFSVWSSRKPSIWLGAFVTRTFCMAQRWQLPIGASIIPDALSCVLDAQQADGGFTETGRVYHKDMTGGTMLSKKAPMTAFVLLSLVDCSSTSNHPTAIANAISYLETGFSAISNNFQLALTTYSLCHAGDKATARDGIRRLWAAASNGPAGTYWTKAEGDTQTYDVPIKGLTIETTAYVLLAMVCMEEDIARVQPIAEFLVQQYSPTGGFVSTQETVVAIHAMIEFAKVNTGVPSPVDMRVDMHSVTETSSAAVHIDSVSVNDTTLNRRFEMLVPRNVANVRLTATGSGKGIMQVACDYRIMESCSKCPFEVSIAFVEKGDKITITVTVRWSADYQYIDNDAMFIVDLDFFSGYTLTEKSKISLGRTLDVGLVEAKQQSVVIYLDQIPLPEDDKMTLTVIAEKGSTFTPAHSTPAVLRVYDYYDPDRRCEVYYSRPNTTSSPSSLCSEDGQCACVSKTCPICDNSICQLTSDFQSNFTKFNEKRVGRGRAALRPCQTNKNGRLAPKPYAQRACDQFNEMNSFIDALEKYMCEDVDFVYRAVLMNSEEVSPTSSWIKLKVRVTEVIKHGAIDFPEEHNGRKILFFYLSKSCTMCGDFFEKLSHAERRKNKQRYFIFGKDSNPLVLEGGSRILREPSTACSQDSGLTSTFKGIQNGAKCQ